MSDEDHVQRNISESADKIRVETKVKRGEGTRDQDSIKVKVKGDDPSEVVARLNATVTQLHATADDLRMIQPEGEQ
jgi:hypothetical protein